MRVIWLVGGFISLALGLIGIILPLLPTVPFLLLATFCFARSSDRLHNWLINHQKLGPPIQDWNEHGAIGRKAKLWATVSVAAAFGISLYLGVATYALVIQAVALSCVMIFIWTRPEH